MKKRLDDSPFDKEYVADLQTTDVATSDKSENVPEIDTKLYGEAKPKRVVCRGRIIPPVISDA